MIFYYPTKTLKSVFDKDLDYDDYESGVFDDHERILFGETDENACNLWDLIDNVKKYWCREII